MNRSGSISKSGRRYRQFLKFSKIVSCLLFSALLLLFLCYSSFSKRIEEMPKADEPVIDVLLPLPPNEVEPETEDISDDFFQFYYENERPSAFGVYDDIFSEEEPPESIPKGELKIVKTDLSKNPTAGTIFLKNNTTYSIDPYEHLTADDISFGASVSPAPEKSPPKVLIYHTHGTEAYAEEGKASYLKSKLPRSTDIRENVVAVGKVVADALNAAGIPTIHCEIMHDEKSYNDSYTYSRQTVLEYLEKYPSIEYVFDIHRDALLDESYVYKVLTYDESTPVAQIMFVVGTDFGGANHPNWKKNLSFAVDAQYLLTKRLENIVRPICIKKSSFYQQYRDGSILIEVGTCVNTLAEAKASAEILGQNLALLINARASL